MCSVSTPPAQCPAKWHITAYSRYYWRAQGFFSWAVLWRQSPESSGPSWTHTILSTVLFVPTAIDEMPSPAGSSARALISIPPTYPAREHLQTSLLCSLSQCAKRIPVLHTLTPSLVPFHPSCLLLNTVQIDCGNSDPSISKNFSSALYLGNDWFSSVRHLENVIFKGTTWFFWSIFWVLLQSIGQMRS